LVLLPFAAGYFLSYFFRTINAVIAGQLTAELGLDASHLGLMTSVYFLTFAAIQLPLGVLLDRFGPRRVQSGLLLVAAVGAAMFARSNQFAALVVGRALIGFGVAGALPPCRGFQRSAYFYSTAASSCWARWGQYARHPRLRGF
jgi:sugar phosphate permease